MVSSKLDVLWPVQVLDTKGDSESLVLFLMRALIGELDDSIFGWLSSELSSHLLHWFVIELDVGHECDTLLHGKLTEHFADDFLLVDVKLDQIAAVGAERAEQV